MQSLFVVARKMCVRTSALKVSLELRTDQLHAITNLKLNGSGNKKNDLQGELIGTTTTTV
jgi:hypothetical protein